MNGAPAKPISAVVSNPSRVSSRANLADHLHYGRGVSRDARCVELAERGFIAYRQQRGPSPSL